MINVSNLIGGVVSIAGAITQPVDALSWDITLGTAGTGLGQLILGRTSSSVDMVPEAVDHVGVVVFGYLYEYGDLGILKTAAPLQSNPKSKYPVFMLRNRERLGETEKSQEEFEEWVDLMNQTDFQGSGYNVVTQSCVVWGIKACNFLGVPHPENWDKICSWAVANSTVANFIGGAGVNSRKVQIKAQAADAPKKLGNYLKKKFRRKQHNGDNKDGESVSSTSIGSSGSGVSEDSSSDSVEDEKLANEIAGREGNMVNQGVGFEVQVEMLSESVTITRL